MDYATKKLLEIDDLKIYGESKNKTSVVSFNIGKIHPYDIGSILDNLGIDRYCCRRMFVAHIDLIDEIAPFSIAREN